MPANPKPNLDPRYGHQTVLVQGAQAAAAKIQQLTSGQSQGNLVDQWGNTVEVAGSNLDQEVTIGAAHLESGVRVRTGIAAGTAGRATAQNVATGTITLTQGSMSATLVSTTSGSFGNGMVIGAADTSDPSSGIATPAIKPGTTMTISGTAITLSEPAAESGSGIYCAACNFVLAEPGTWQSLTLTPGQFIAAAGHWTPQGRLTSDLVTLRGAVTNNSGGTIVNPTPATVPAALIPQSTVLFAASPWSLSTAGNLTYSGSVANGSTLGLDGLVYTTIAA